jgi:hypothetical protein
MESIQQGVLDGQQLVLEEFLGGVARARLQGCPDTPLRRTEVVCMVEDLVKGYAAKSCRLKRSALARRCPEVLGPPRRGWQRGRAAVSCSFD